MSKGHLLHVVFREVFDMGLMSNVVDKFRSFSLYQVIFKGLKNSVSYYYL